MKEIEIKVMLEGGAVMPRKAHTTDAGYDLFTPRDIYLRPGSNTTIETGVHMQIPTGYVGMLKSKSGLNVNHNITNEGVIDADYTGSIVVKLYNHSAEPYHFYKGDKISQIVILPIPDTKLIEVTELEETERGENGFGSSGR